VNFRFVDGGYQLLLGPEGRKSWWFYDYAGDAVHKKAPNRLLICSLKRPSPAWT